MSKFPRFWKVVALLIIVVPLIVFVVLLPAWHPTLDSKMLLLGLLFTGVLMIDLAASIRPLQEQLNRIESKLDALSKSNYRQD